LQPAVLIPAFISCWSIAVLGGFFAVVGIGNLRRHHLASEPPVARRGHFPLQRQLFLMWDAFLVMLGGLLMAAGMIILYTLVYG
jgi:hypothetical protein